MKTTTTQKQNKGKTDQHKRLPAVLRRVEKYTKLQQQKNKKTKTKHKLQTR